MAGLSLKEKLASRPCFGTFLKLPRPEVVHILALAGFDFVICDMEHSQTSEVEARAVIRECVSVSLPVVVRLPDPSQGVVNRLLEAGATGIQMPRLQTSDDTRHMYKITHFPPNGGRSFGNANVAAQYGSVSNNAYLESENTRVLTVGQFETRAMESPCDSMMDGLDVAFIGPQDLSIDYGVPGNFMDDNVQEHIRKVEMAARRTGTFMGAFAGTPEQAKMYIDADYRFIAVGGDIGMLVKQSKSLVSELHGR
ncbi:HpcH/HpaI aldolase family protein [Alicyclobacillus sp. ALC3]|uniref:HpcH/HpaI aldolase family protein n=1 Tax=Alicyclobacillus sp. ALC3 TaxID=2796143 RepID=UPI002378F901|nr:aldolase/citrate lyase family protein [Alicyclobacillus sp. ALC3]WDL97752.1 hypothetical protein JC200_03200 [Alicyclobacillus sp. ALC3]